MGKEPKPPKAAGPADPLRRAVDALTGARLCYGDPVQAGERTIIPVARVRLSGGWGFGRGGPGAEAGAGSGGGGGGHLDATPIGFIEVGPTGSRYQEIPDPEKVARTLKAAAGAATALITGIAGARRLNLGRRTPARRRIGR